MGTSKSHSTPRDYKKKPHDEEKEPFEKNEPQDDNSWRKASNSFSRYVNGSGAIGKAVASYGSAKLSDLTTDECFVNIETLENLCELFDVQDYDSFVSKFDEYSKSSLEAFIAELINSIASAGIFREDVAARKALTETLKDFSKNMTTIDAFLTELFKKRPLVVTDYVKRYISEQLLTDMSIKIEANCSTAFAAINVENEIKDFISKIDYAFDCDSGEAAESLRELLRMLSL